MKSGRKPVPVHMWTSWLGDPDREHNIVVGRTSCPYMVDRLTWCWTSLENICQDLNLSLSLSGLFLSHCKKVVVVWCLEKAATCSVLWFNIFIKPDILPLSVFIIMFTTLSGWKHLVSNRDSSTNRKTVKMCWMLIEMCHVSNSHTADTLEFCQRTRRIRSSMWYI